MSKRIREQMDVPFDVKSLDEESGTFEGYASVFGNVDLGGDVVVPGAFKRTLSHSGGAIPILWHHDPETPVGIGLSASEDEHGLKVRGQLDTNTQKGREMLSGLKMGYIGAMSIGYETVDKEMKDGVRYLKEIALPEYSLLTKGFAMNPEAEVFAVKSLADVDDIKALLDDPDALEAKVGRRFSEASLADIRTAIATLEALIGESDADDAPDEDGKALDDGSHEAPVADAPDAPEGPRMDEAKRRELLNTLTRDLATLTID